MRYYKKIQAHYAVCAKTSTKDIKAKNPGILNVPEGKSVQSLPKSHFEGLMKSKGRAPIMRALLNLERWNKKDNAKLSKWARKMIDSLKEED